MTRRYLHSFKPIVQLKRREVCGWKKHYRGVLRELIGLLDGWAANDPERFVPARMGKIVKYCTRYKGAAYKDRAVYDALKELRDRGIVSKRVTRWRYGHLLEGVIVATHESFITHEGNLCVFRGASLPQGIMSPIAVENAVPIAVENAVPIAVPIAVKNAAPNAVHHSVQAIEGQSDDGKKRPQSVVAERTERAEVAVPASPTPVTGATKNGSGMVRDGLAAACSSQSFTAEEETLWQEMRNHTDFPEDMRGAVPRKEQNEKRRVLEQLKKHGVEVVVQALATWADERDMGLAGLGTRWRAWLEEGEPFLRNEAENT